MNPSAHSFVHTATDACSYPSAYADTCYGATYTSHPYPGYDSSLYEDASSWTQGWSSDSGPCPEADRALFEAFLTADVASISPPDPCPAVPIQSPPSYYAASNFPLHPTEATQLYAEGLGSYQSYPYPTSSSKSAMPPAFAQLRPEPTTSCISPDLIYPSAFCHGQSDLAADYSSDTTPRSSPASRRASHRSPSFSPYPTPSPEPSSPRTSSNTIIIASQRRNAPAGAALPAPNAWQCPHCPYVQRNRRSPDLKRHIKTHTRDDEVADWVCCGVPVRNAAELGVPAAVVRAGPVFEFDGVRMVGGCRRAFSRRDALHRHLQRESGRCFGDAQSLHQRGNRESC